MKKISLSVFSYYLFSTVVLVLSLLSHEQHDYVAYVKQWNHILEYGQAYEKYGNAYGIVYSLFAYLIPALGTMFPKFIFLLLYISSVKILLSNSESKNWLILWITLLNPLFLLFGLSVGSNDLFSGSLLLFSVYYWGNQDQKRSALTLALGTFFKFIPGFVTPVFLLKSTNLKLNRQFILTYGLITLVILSIGYVLWGESILNPVIFGQSRNEKMLSIFRFLKGDYNPFDSNLDYNYYSTMLILTSVVSIYVLYYWKKIELPLATVLIIGFTFLFYKVGHHQFYFHYVLLLAFLIYRYESFLVDKFAFYSSLLFVIWLNVLVLIYYWTNYLEEYYWVREIVGLPNSILLLINLIAIMRFSMTEKKIAKTQIESL